RVGNEEGWALLGWEVRAVFRARHFSASDSFSDEVVLYIDVLGSGVGTGVIR
ncbi:MAG: hypothetical protein TREMPRED_002909, partial [Tremellales sp. Tagirdzhanova-0007]